MIPTTCYQNQKTIDVDLSQLHDESLGPDSPGVRKLQEPIDAMWQRLLLLGWTHDIAWGRSAVGLFRCFRFCWMWNVWRDVALMKYLESFGSWGFIIFHQPSSHPCDRYHLRWWAGISEVVWSRPYQTRRGAVASVKTPTADGKSWNFCERVEWKEGYLYVEIAWNCMNHDACFSFCFWDWNF